MKEFKKYKGVLLTVVTAIVLISLCAVFLNTLLARAAEADVDVLHTEPAGTTLGTSAIENDLDENLDIIVYEGGFALPENAVSAQYAVAVASELSERVWQKPLTGRVFVQLNEMYGAGSGLYWDVNGEMVDGSINCTIDTATGTDVAVRYSDTVFLYDWFDNWNEEVAEQERLEAEEFAREINERDAALQASQPQPSEGEQRALMDLKRQGMLDFTAEMSGAPHGEKAVEIVNSTGIGDGAQALSGQVVIEGDYDGYAIFGVEVALDNGKYLVLTMGQDTQELWAYERYDTDLADFLYG